MPYDLFGFISGDHSIFRVSIDETELVVDLKEKIKKRTKPKLNDIAAHDLKLYRVEVDTSCDIKKLIDVLERLSRELNEWPELFDVRVQVMEYLNGSPPPEKKYYIIVRVPESKSMYCGGVMATVVLSLRPCFSWDHTERI